MKAFFKRLRSIFKKKGYAITHILNYPRTQPYIFSIKNKGKESIKFDLLRRYINYPTDVEIEFLNVPDEDIKYQEAIEDMYLGKIKIMYIQLTGSGKNSIIVPFNKFTVTQRGSTGSTSTMSYTPLLAAGQFQNTVSFLNVNIPIDSLTYFTFIVDPESSLQVALYPENIKQPSKIKRILHILLEW